MHNTTHVRPWSKNGPKNKFLTKQEKAKLLSPFDLSFKNKHLKKDVKIGWKVTELCPFSGHVPNWHLAYFVYIYIYTLR